VSGATETAERARRAAEGDEEAFRRLVRELYPTLRRWALARTGDPDDADEVVQHTLIRMHRNLHRFSGRSKLTTWLYRILSNIATDLERAQRARRATPVHALDDDIEAGTPDPLRSLHAGVLSDAVRSFMESLPPRQRQVLELVDHQGRSATEVAEMLGIAPGSVRASLFKARRSVRRAVLDRYPDLTEGYEA
jgi:RNA polymerase sigma-70 factor (ECF subfamily)